MNRVLKQIVCADCQHGCLIQTEEGDWIRSAFDFYKDADK